MSCLVSRLNCINDYFVVVVVISLPFVVLSHNGLVDQLFLHFHILQTLNSLVLISDASDTRDVIRRFL